ncbi:MAG TPA: hypothetical protein VK506_05545 [Conexibacter sp.]|nr:hypothetical protein [Conexibacter sp.]
MALVQASLGITPTSRVKTTGTILEKLHRQGGSWLKNIQDIAGMRIVGTFDRAEQDELVARLAHLFDGDRRPRVVDRRMTPSHGYRAVHVIVLVRSVPVEIQVRTQLQHEWADLFEKLADKIGRGIRYGEPPEAMPQTWYTTLPPDQQKMYDLRYRIRRNVVRIAQAVAGMIDAYEVGALAEPHDPELRDYRAEVDAALAAFTEELDDL